MRTAGWVERSKVRARGGWAGVQAARSEGEERDRGVEAVFFFDARTWGGHQRRMCRTFAQALQDQGVCEGEE